jgi:diguanylate cyclase (GGDEF)-like protein/PAS domain S-box-containing protein
VSLLSRLLLLVTFSVLPPAILEAWRAAEDRHEHRSEIPATALRIAQLAATDKRRIVDGARQLLTALSSLQSIRERDETQCGQTLRDVREQFPIYTILGVVSVEGRIWCSSATPGTDISDRAGFRGAIETGHFTIGEYIVGTDTGRRTLHLTLPIYDENRELFGVLTAGLDLDRLALDLAETPLPPGVTLTIADPKGRVLVDLPDGTQVGQLLPVHLQGIVEADLPGVIDAEWIDGIRQVVGYVPPKAQPGPGFLVAIGLNHEQAYADVDRRGTEALAISAAVLATALLGAWWFAARFIRRPIARLTGVAERWRQGDLTARARLGDPGSETGRLGQAFDAMAEAVAERERRLRDVLESTTDSVLTLDQDWRVTFLNARAEAKIARGRQLLGQNIWQVFPEAAGGAFWQAYHRTMAERVPTQVTAFYEPLGCHYEANVFPSPDGGITGFIRDVTEHHQAQERLRYLAYHDPLTGLINRTRLREITGQRLAGSAAGALVLLDLDGFKHVNDTLGHAAGDTVLRDAATCLSTQLGGRGTLARLGGDEFAALLPELSSTMEAEAVVQELQTALEAESFCVRERVFHLGASAGLVFIPAGLSIGPETLLANADLALYRAKAAGRGVCQTFHAGIREEYEARRMLEEEIGRATACGEFELHYQPQVRLTDGALVGAEALLRWRHPVRGLLHPGLFLEALETSPHACRVGNWAIGEACRQAAAWRAAGLRLRIGVNLFSEQLRAGDLPDTVEAALACQSLPPEALELELTENIVLRQEEGLLAPLRALRARGVGIAFDDFGTGFASLTTLKNVPLTRLKIDRGFMADLAEGTHDAAIVDAVLALGRNLGLDVIAEGVETAAQEAFLAAHGCAEGQGYRYGRSMLPDTFLAASHVREAY